MIITDETKVKGRFKELMNESNQGNTFRVFDCHDDAETWLLSNSRQEPVIY